MYGEDEHLEMLYEDQHGVPDSESYEDAPMEMECDENCPYFDHIIGREETPCHNCCHDYLDNGPCQVGCPT